MAHVGTKKWDERCGWMPSIEQWCERWRPVVISEVRRRRPMATEDDYQTGLVGCCKAYHAWILSPTTCSPMLRVYHDIADALEADRSTDKPVESVDIADPNGRPTDQHADDARNTERIFAAINALRPTLSELDQHILDVLVVEGADHEVAAIAFEHDTTMVRVNRHYKKLVRTIKRMVGA